MPKYGKTHNGPWYADEGQRIFFERQSEQHFCGLRRQFGALERAGERGLLYKVKVDVPFYEQRQVQVFFHPRRRPTDPIVIVDGPIESPHRYPSWGRRRLCLWYPDDPPEAQWQWQDGLLQLLGLTKLHLFREAWWRETGEWSGPQAPHAVPPEEDG